MITRRARPRYRVAVEVTHAGGWRAWNAVAAAFEQRLAAQASPVVHEPRLESETRRGSDVVRVRIAMTVRAADPGQAAVIAWDVFKVAVGEDAAMWDLDAASAEIRPEAQGPGYAGSPRWPYRGVEVPLAIRSSWSPAVLARPRHARGRPAAR